MKCCFVLLNVLCTLALAFPGGGVEIPVDYIDIGQLELSAAKTHDTLFLPYVKPPGINKIITSSVKGLIINEMIVDGRITAPKKIWFDMGAYEAISYVYEQDVSGDENQFFMPMGWGTSGGTITYDERLSERRAKDDRNVMENKRQDRAWDCILFSSKISANKVCNTTWL